jgi:hypothetical protein
MNKGMTNEEKQEWMGLVYVPKTDAERAVDEAEIIMRLATLKIAGRLA